MNSKKQKFMLVTNNKNWISWSQGYLYLAEQGFLYFKNKKRVKPRTASYF